MTQSRTSSRILAIAASLLAASHLAFAQPVAPPMPQVRGLVTDDKAVPQPNVWVAALDGSINAPALTDADGRFTLDVKGQDQVLLLAARGHDLGAEPASPGEEVFMLIEAKPAPVVPDTARAFALLDALWREPGEGVTDRLLMRLPADLAAVDPALAFKVAQNPPGAGLVVDAGQMIALAIERMAEVNPELAAKWAPAQLEKIAAAQRRASVAASLGLALADANPAIAQQILEAHQDLAQVGEPKASAPGAYFGLAALAARLKQPSAQKLLDTGLKLVDELYPANSQQSLTERLNAVDILARGSADLSLQVVAQLPTSWKRGALQLAVPRLATHDGDGARRALAELEKVEGRKGAAYGLALRNALPAWAKQKPDEALALARTVTDERNKAVALALAANGDRAVLREASAAIDPELPRAVDVAQIGALAFAADPTLSRELFDRAEALANKGKPNALIVAQVAWLISRADPARARLLIEKFAAGNLQGIEAAPNGLAKKFASAPATLPPLAKAMSGADAERALELAYSNDDPVSRFNTLAAIARRLLAPAKADDWDVEWLRG